MPHFYASVAFLTLALMPSAASSHPCESCHPKEVRRYALTAMGRSLRSARGAPDGAFEHTFSKTRFVMRSTPSGVYQQMEYGGQTSDYRIGYILGSGTHASCYLAQVGDHLFQSPVCFFASRGYDMAPGYEANRAPGFTRSVTPECLLCHSGKPMAIADSLNTYETPPFAEESISCGRCHGDPSAHLKRPTPRSIVNPARLTSARRDAVCERCHLAGLARVVNPGKKLTDYSPGCWRKMFSLRMWRRAEVER